MLRYPVASKRLAAVTAARTLGRRRRTFSAGFRQERRLYRRTWRGVMSLGVLRRSKAERAAAMGRTLGPSLQICSAAMLASRVHLRCRRESLELRRRRVSVLAIMLAVGNVCWSCELWHFSARYRYHTIHIIPMLLSTPRSCGCVLCVCVPLSVTRDR